MTLQQGDIVRVVTSAATPEPSDEVPREGWLAIVIDIDEEDGQVEIAWLSQMSTELKRNGGPVKEYWDNSTRMLSPGYDCEMYLQRRATYSEVTVG